MATKFEKPADEKPVTEQQATTPLEAMPPLNVTTEGIPPQEHVEASPPEPALTTEHPNRAWQFVLAAAGVLGLVLLGGLVILALRPAQVAVNATHMGLDQQAWSAYRAGERVSTTPVHMGLTTPQWQAYRAGERVTPGLATDHMGLAGDTWAAFRVGEQYGWVPTSHLGLALPAWQAYRSGEQAAATTVSPTGHQGLDGYAWAQYRAGERTGAEVPDVVTPASDSGGQP
jgi:hypothetical protein